jgi:hypothetical protein
MAAHVRAAEPRTHGFACARPRAADEEIRASHRHVFDARDMRT